MPRYIIDQAEQHKLKKLVAKAAKHVEELKEISRPKTTFETISEYWPLRLFVAQPLRQVSLPSEKLDKKLSQIMRKMNEKAFENVIALLTQKQLIEDVALLVEDFPDKYGPISELVESAQHISEFQDDMLVPEKLYMLKALKTLVLSDIHDAIHFVRERIQTRRDAAEIVDQQIQKLEDAIDADHSDALAQNQEFVEALQLLTELYPQKYSKHNDLLSKAKDVYFSKEAFRKTALSMQELKELEISVKKNLKGVKQAQSLEDALGILGEETNQQNLTTIASVFPNGYHDCHLAAQSAQAVLNYKGDFLPEEQALLLNSLQTLNADKITETFTKVKSVADERAHAKAKIDQHKRNIAGATSLDDLLGIVLGDFSGEVAFLAEAYPDKYNRMVSIVELCKKIDENTVSLLASEKNSLLQALKPLHLRAAAKAFSGILEAVEQRNKAKSFVAQRVKQLAQQEKLSDVFKLLQDKSWTSALELLSDSLGGRYTEYLSIAPKTHSIHEHLHDMIEAEKLSLLLAFRSLKPSAIESEIQNVLFTIERRQNALALFEKIMQAVSHSTELSEMLALFLEPDFATAIQVLRNDFPGVEQYLQAEELLIYAKALEPRQAEMLRREKSELIEAFKSLDPQQVSKCAEAIESNIRRRKAAEENIGKALSLVQQPTALTNKAWIDKDPELKKRLVFLTKEKPNSDLQSTFDDLCVYRKPAVVFSVVHTAEIEVQGLANQVPVNDSPVADEDTSKISRPKNKVTSK